MKYKFSTECTWLYLFLRTFSGTASQILYPRTNHDIDLRQTPNRQLYTSTLATPAKRGQ